MNRDGGRGPRSVSSIPDPTWAYVPGQTPRHPDHAFDTLRNGVRTGMTSRDLACSDAWRAGLQFLDRGFFWEAHEVIEPVWLTMRPGSPERALVQAVIQIANAELKARMERPRAVLRLCDMAADLLARGDSACAVMGLDAETLNARIVGLRRDANRYVPPTDT